MWAIAFYLAGATFGASLIIAAIVSFVRSKGPDDVLDSEKIRTAASKIDKKKDEIADKIKIAFAEPHNGVSYCDQLKENLITILTQVKLQELKALEGLFNYDQQ